MSNAVYGKTMKNLRNIIDVRLVSNPDHFKTKKVCKNVIKKLSFVIMINMRLKKCAVNLF